MNRNYLIRLLWSVIIIFTFCTISVWAQKPLSKRIGVDENNPLTISVKDAIRMALENNSDIEIERLNVQQADADLLSANGGFDPVIAFSQFFTRQNNPVTSSLGGSSTGVVTNKTYNSSFDLRGLLKTGATYEVTASASRFDTNNFFATLNPQTNTELNFQFRQPLFRNREIDETRRKLLVAKKRIDISDNQFRQRVLEIISQVERAYWDLVFARRSVDIVQESVELADTQLQRAKRLIDAGSQAPVDLVQIEAQKQLRQENLLISIESVSKAENALKVLILANAVAPEWQRAFVPTDEPDIKTNNFDLPSLIRLAYDNRPEVKQLLTQKELVEDEVKYYRNQTKPQVDLVANYTLTGLAGTQIVTNNPLSLTNTLAPVFTRINDLSKMFNLPLLSLPPASTQPGFLVGGLGQSLGNLFRNRFNTIRVGVQVQLPLRNRNALGQLARAQFESKKIDTLSQKATNYIEVEVRNAFQSVRTTEERIQAAHAARVAAEQQLESEQRRYEAGLSTNFLVLTRQQELSESRGRELRALTDFDKAYAELQRVIGSTLSIYNVSVVSSNNP